jgi:hypothetical protein
LSPITETGHPATRDRVNTGRLSGLFHGAPDDGEGFLNPPPGLW